MLMHLWYYITINFKTSGQCRLQLKISFSETNPNQIIADRILFVLRQRNLKHLSIVKSLKLSNNIFI